MNDNDRVRREVSATLAEIEASESKLQLLQRKIIDTKFFEPDNDAAEALAIIDRIERRWAANTMSTKPKEPT